MRQKSLRVLKVTIEIEAEAQVIELRAEHLNAFLVGEASDCDGRGAAGLNSIFSNLTRALYNTLGLKFEIVSKI